MSATEYYNHSTYPAQGASGSSAAMRAELELVETGFGKLPDLAGNGTKLVAVNSGGTALEATAVPALGTPASGVLTNCTGLPVAGGGTGRATGTTAYALVATGTTATGAQQSLAAGATTEVLVGGGASALPVWTAATGSGAPVRATSPALVTPDLGTPSALVGTNITGTAAGLTAGAVTTNANLTGHVTSVGNAAVLGSFTMAQLNTAISDGDIPSARVSCYLGTDQILANAGVWYKLNFDTELYDTYAEYDTGTHTFTAASSGGYEIQLTARFGLGNVGDWAEVAVYVNGSRKRTVRASTADATWAYSQPTVVCSLSLSANDTIEFYGYYNSASGSRGVYGTGLSGECTFASIKRL